MEDENGTTTETTEITTPQDGKQENVTPDGKNGEQSKLFTQEQLNDIVEGRLARERRNLTDKLLGDYGAENAEDLQARLKQLADIEETQKQADEAAKSDLQRANDEIASLKDTQVKQSESMRIKDIKYTLSVIAPKKEVPADRFDDLFMLMDVSGIKFVDGAIDEKEVESAIDKALETREYLKAAPAPEQRKRGTPTRTNANALQNQNDNKSQTPQRRRKASM